MMKRRYLLLLAIALVLTPGAWIVISDLYVGLIAPDTSTRARESARWILLRDVLRGQTRTAEERQFKPVDPLSQTNAPVISVRPSPNPLWEDPPTCPEFVIGANKPKVESFGNRSHVSMQSIPVRFPLRVNLADDARFFAYGESLSVMQLALLDACFLASPFAKQCDDWLEAREPARSDVLKELVTRGWVTQRSGSYCWVTPEFGFSQ